jgi:hypothetical protein
MTVNAVKMGRNELFENFSLERKSGKHPFVKNILRYPEKRVKVYFEKSVLLNELEGKLVQYCKRKAPWGRDQVTKRIVFQPAITTSLAFPVTGRGGP